MEARAAEAVADIMDAARFGGSVCYNAEAGDAHGSGCGCSACTATWAG